MNVTAFKQAREAYAAKDYKTALAGFLACSHELDGLSGEDKAKFFQLLGNCRIKTGDARRAAESYTRALSTASEERKPSLYASLGTALLGVKDYEAALSAFDEALDCPGYRTPYKAYSGIGAAQLALGKTEEAGAAWREAALDPSNPKPAKALVNLGACFMELARPADAVVSYETALDLGLDKPAANKAWAALGQAYMAEGRVKRAIAAFEEACADGSYELSAMAVHDLDVARGLEKRLEAKAPGILDTASLPVVSADGAGAAGAAEKAAGAEGAAGADRTGNADGAGADDARPDPFAPQTREDGGDARFFSDVTGSMEAYRDEGYSTSYAAGDDAAGGRSFDDADDGRRADDTGRFAGGYAPGQTGDIPSPEMSGFFDRSEEQIDEEAEMMRRHKKRRSGSVGLKVAIAIVALLIVVVAAGIGAYAAGYGYPSAESVAQDFFTSAQSKKSADDYWDSSVDSSSRSSQISALSGTSGCSVEAVERGMAQSKVYVKSTLQEGGDISYEVGLGRDGLGWKVLYVSLYFPSRQ